MIPRAAKIKEKPMFAECKPFPRLPSFQQSRRKVHLASSRCHLGRGPMRDFAWESRKYLQSKGFASRWSGPDSPADPKCCCLRGGCIQCLHHMFWPFNHMWERQNYSYLSEVLGQCSSLVVTWGSFQSPGANPTIISKENAV